MIEQCLFLTLCMYLTLGNIWRRTIVCRKTAFVEKRGKVMMMFSHAVNACSVHGVFYVQLRKICGTLFYVDTNNSYFP